MNKVKKGKEGESKVVTLLLSKGYQVLHRNYRYHRKEVDIVAVKGHTLVFVEVKLRGNASFGRGYEALDWRKQKNILLVAQQYVHEYKLYDYNVRFDVASIDRGKINYIENAFQV